MSPRRAAIYAATSEEPRSGAHIARIVYGEEGHAETARQHLLWLQAQGLVEKARRGEWRRPASPTVAAVAGIRVMIFYNDHAPPHVHLSKGDMDVVVPIDEPTLPSWAFTRTERRVVLDWIGLRAPELHEAWARAGEGTHPGKVDAP